MKFNIYVPSYHRSDAILTGKNLEYCTYVVRRSEEDAYMAAGVENLISVEDKEIDSAAKAFAWIYANSEEDVICILDDDIESFYYRLETLDEIVSPETVTMEIERLAQLLYDLDVGYLACPIDVNIKFYDRPFKFTGITGAMKIYNKRKFKARDKMGLLYLADLDIELQELLLNRIIMIPEYFCLKATTDTNAGGNSQKKSLSQIEAENDIMKNKWGRYYVKANGGKSGRINVKR